jgi:transcriptional regulator with PAS, ATPase and Fis domain
MRVGGTKTIHSDFRLIAASNRNLRQEVETGRFREDLFYRINVINLEIPPLRSRPEDLINLISRFLEHFNLRYKENKRLSSQVYKRLLNYRWLGNVRELENIIERIIITSDGMEITEEALPDYILKTNEEDESFIPEKNLKTPEPALSDSVRNLEMEQIIRAYEKHGTTTGVARELGISQPTAYRKVKKYMGLKK